MYVTDLVGTLIFERVMWLLLIGLMLVGLTILYWNATRSIGASLREGRQQVVGLETVSKNIEHAIHKIEEKMQRQLKSIEGKVAHLSTTVGELQHETSEIEKHVESLESKTSVEVGAVDTIKHQVDLDVTDLKRIDDQVRTNKNGIDRIARHIDHLEVEIHGLLPGPPPRLSRDRHFDQ